MAQTIGVRVPARVPCYNLVMEQKPDTENVHYLDEYPHLEEKVRLRRLAAARPLGHAAVFIMPLPINYRELMEQPPRG